MNNMIITISIGALLVGAAIYLAGCGPIGGTAPFVQINSQDTSSNSNDNNSPTDSGQKNSLSVTNENPLVRVSCNGTMMDGTWSGVCGDVHTQGTFSCPGDTRLDICANMCFVYADITACI